MQAMLLGKVVQLESSLETALSESQRETYFMVLCFTSTAIKHLGIMAEANKRFT